MSAALIALAVRIGAPLVESALVGRIGRSNAGLVTNVIKTIAGNAGMPVSRLSDPEIKGRDVETIEQAVMMTEDAMPELIALYEAELDGKMRLLEAEQRGPLWTWAWRPAGMWGLGFFWLYNVALLHWFNAYFKIALPVTDYGTLIQISALYMSLYMGGHTVKDVMSKWAGGRA